jgi:hypothetical protein
MNVSREIKQDAAEAGRLARLDANETAMFAQKLEHEQAQAVLAEFPELKAKSFIPIDTTVDPGADSFVWYYYEQIGLAKIVANYATDLPNITMFGKKNISPIESVGASYGYSVQDIARAAKTGLALEGQKSIFCREAIERVHDRILAHGDPATGIPGFLDHPNVTVIDTGFTGDWTDEATTSKQILADLMIMAFYLRGATKQVHGSGGLRMILGTEGYEIIATRIFSDYTGASVLKTFMEAQKIVTEVESWEQCDLADEQGDGERIVVYEPQIRNLKGLVPKAFDALPAQASGLDFLVPCFGRTGGTVVQKPLSMVYFDGLLDA